MTWGRGEINNGAKQVSVCGGSTVCVVVERERRPWRKRRGAGASVFLCRRLHCQDASQPLLANPSPMDPTTSPLRYDITPCRPSQPRLVGSDERVSQ